ncbi:MAG TPA: AAA family ATPase [Burkholderiales bacterium]|nr:AAA family ATPase [Burkholderiales bacterium]
MYLEYFGLREMPFGITPDTSFFLAFKTYQEALNTLLVAIQTGEGFIKITGEVGTGKTLLCRKFLGSLGNEYVTAYIPNPYLEPHALLLTLADELGVPQGEGRAQHELFKTLSMALVGYAGQGKQVVVCVDEAQAMPLESIEALRLLSNIETEKRKLLQVVLFGQPELDVKLNRDSVRQLTQRITFFYELGPLNRQETEYYLAHRLSMAGYTGGQLIDKAAVNYLYRLSRGIPRLINILAHKSMLLAYGEGSRQINRHHVQVACRDTLVLVNRRNYLKLWLAVTVLGCAGVGIGFAWIYFK